MNENWELFKIILFFYIIIGRNVFFVQKNYLNIKKTSKKVVMVK
jgi:hypothetical protein